MDNMKIGKYIAALRKEKKLTQQQLADKLMITNKAVSKWETGEGLPDINILPALAEVLDTSIDVLLSGVEKIDGCQLQGNEVAGFIIEKNQLRFKKACLISFSAGILGIIVMAGILMNDLNGRDLSGLAAGLGLLCQLISLVIFEISLMTVNSEIKNYNYRFAEGIVPYKSRMNFYKKIIWVWSFIPVWYFANIFFENFHRLKIFNMIRFPKDLIIPVFFMIVYFIVCALISIGIFLTGKYKSKKSYKERDEIIL